MCVQDRVRPFPTALFLLVLSEKSAIYYLGQEKRKERRRKNLLSSRREGTLLRGEAALSPFVIVASLLGALEIKRKWPIGPEKLFFSLAHCRRSSSGISAPSQTPPPPFLSFFSFPFPSSILITLLLTLSRHSTENHPERRKGK